MTNKHAVLHGELTLPGARVAEWRASTVDPKTMLDLATTRPAWFDGDLDVRTVDGWLSLLAGAPYCFGDEDGGAAGELIDVALSGARLRLQAVLGDDAMAAWAEAIAALFRSAAAFGGEGALLIAGPGAAGDLCIEIRALPSLGETRRDRPARPARRRARRERALASP